MLHLLESAGRVRQRVTGWAAASAAMHASAIALAIVAGTRDAVSRLVSEAPPPDIVFTVTPAPTAPSAPSGGGTTSRFTRPPIDLSRVALPTFSLAVSGQLPPALALLPGPPMPRPGVQGDSVIGGMSRSLFTERGVDRAAAPRAGNRSPEFPAILRAAGIEGEVLVRFIVDTGGLVEAGSIEVVQATHALFAESVRRWLPKTGYAPAEVRGTPVRQLVEQRVDFRLK